MILLQENCPVHTARIIKRWFEDQRHVDLIEWPSKGCNLNPIENIWANIVNSWTPQHERMSNQLMYHTNK